MIATTKYYNWHIKFIFPTYQSFCSAEMRGMCEGGKSLQRTAIEKYPTKKTEPIDRNKHPHNCLSSIEPSQRIIESPQSERNFPKTRRKNKQQKRVQVNFFDFF